MHKSYLADKGFLLLLSANFFMKKAIPYLTNKYLIAAILFIVWMLFYDQRDYFQQKERRDELKKIGIKESLLRTGNRKDQERVKRPTKQSSRY